MSDLLAYLPAVAALWLGCYELRLLRDGSDSPYAVRCLCRFGFCMAAAMALLAAPTLHLEWPWSPRLTHLLGREMEMAALAFLPPAVIEIGLPRPRLLTARLHVGVSVSALVLCAVLFLSSGVRTRHGSLLVEGTGAPLLASSDAVFTGYSLWCLAVFLVPVHRFARGLGPGALRTGLRLITASVAVGLVWALWGVSAIVTVAVDHRQSAGLDQVGRMLGLCCLVLGFLGGTAGGRVAVTTAVGRWLRAYRTYRALEPLWSALRSVSPGAALDLGRPPVRLFSLHRSEFAIYRRVIEIRDGYLELRAFVPPDARALSEAALDRFPVPPSGRAAMAEAAVIAAALESARTGPVAPADRDVALAYPVGCSVEEEAAWLVQVSEALTVAGLVEHMRHRVALPDPAGDAASLRRPGPGRDEGRSGQGGGGRRQGRAEGQGRFR
ncbi:MAB_1171c family putative transporter [Streptomyces sp. NPDC057540]|uniref:MAB_1171c family putative transporter n=1 Tax=Streptomyces sp. NPDC057540 TaxID=3346160 RepID=UPI0036B9F37F